LKTKYINTVTQLYDELLHNGEHSTENRPQQAKSMAERGFEAVTRQNRHTREAFPGKNAKGRQEVHHHSSIIVV
jgi:uncharacterized glyoxalase superfamily metalloenzyme YdcJ